MFTIRATAEADLPATQAIEVGAGSAFKQLDMDLVAGDDPMPIERLREYVIQGRSWVAVDSSQRILGYLIADIVDNCGHVEQVSVDPDFRGQRIGRALIDACSDWARHEGLPALTLTTYREVPRNGPYYEGLGFSYLADETPGLKLIRQDEHEAGLDAWPRASMYRTV